MPSITETSVEVQLRELLQLFAEVRPFVSTDDTLPALTAMRIEVVGNEIRVAATDRYVFGMSRLVLAEDATPPAEQRRLLSYKNVDAIKQMFKPRKGMPTFLRLTFGAKGLRVADIHSLPGLPKITLDCEWIDAETFPVVDSLLAKKPDPVIVEMFALNASYLAKFSHVVRDVEPIRIHPAAPGNAVRVTVGDHFVGLIMPIRQADGDVAWDPAVRPKAKPAPRKRSVAGRTKKAAW